MCSMKTAKLIFPHQLFKESALLNDSSNIYLIEEYLFFKQYNFHKQKIAFHRASMKFYEEYLSQKGLNVKYIESAQEESDIRILIKKLHEYGYTSINVIDPIDDWLSKRIKKTCLQFNIDLIVQESPMFLNTNNDLKNYFGPAKKRFFQTEFYKQERIKRNILMDGAIQPIGGEQKKISEK